MAWVLVKPLCLPSEASRGDGSCIRQEIKVAFVYQNIAYIGRSKTAACTIPLGKAVGTSFNE
jgi:hypothetical protein